MGTLSSSRPPWSVQQLLLGLGAISLVAAGVQVGVANWQHVPASSRAALLIWTCVFGIGLAKLTARRGMTHTSTALSVVWVSLAFVAVTTLREVAGTGISDAAFFAWAGGILCGVFAVALLGLPGAPVRFGLTVAWIMAGWSTLAVLGVEIEDLDIYALPVAIAVMAWQFSTTRDLPGSSSWNRYGTGLWVVMAPAIFVTLDARSPLRWVVVAGVATALIALGMRLAHRAPLMVGAWCIGILAAVQALDLSARTPSWLALGVAGVVLVGLGASLEVQRRFVAKVRTSLGSYT